MRRLRRGDPAPAAYRGLLLALWEAGRLGACGIVLSTDDAGVAAQVAGRAAPPPEALGVYLQVRALLNAVRPVGVDYRTAEEDPDTAAAVAAAAGALSPAPPRCSDLPLWTAAAAV